MNWHSADRRFPKRPLLIAGTALLLIAAAFFAYRLFFAPGKPSQSQLQNALVEKLSSLNGASYSIKAFQVVPVAQRNPGPDGRFYYTSTISTRLNGTLYLPVNSATFIQGEMHLDISAANKIYQILSSPDAAHIRELAGVHGEANALAGVQLIRETARTGQPFDITATLRAERTLTGWDIAIPALTPGAPLPQGKPLATFSQTRLFDTTRESDLAAIRRLVAQNNDTLRRLEQARTRHQAELAAQTLRATNAALDSLAPGTFFKGIGTLPRNENMSAMSLEILALDRTAGTIAVLLRTDNSWSEMRRLDGTFAYDLTASALILTLSARQGVPLVSAAGAQINNGSAFKLTLRFAGTSLSGSTRGWTCALTRVPDVERAAFVEAGNFYEKRLFEITRPGLVYRVTAHAVDSNETTRPTDFPPGEMVLRIVSQDTNTRAITATLEAPLGNWKQQLTGTIITNIFRANNAPIQLSSGAGIGVNASATPLLLAFSPSSARDSGDANNAMTGTLKQPGKNYTAAVTIGPATDAYLTQAAAQKVRAAEEALLARDRATPTLEKLPLAPGAYLWNNGLWLSLPNNDARVVRSTLQKIGGVFSAAASIFKSRIDKQDTGTLVFEGHAQPSVASGRKTVLAFRGTIKIYTGIPQGRVPVEIAALEIKDGGQKRTVELERLGEAATTFGGKCEALSAEAFAGVTGANAGAGGYLIRVASRLAPGRYALAVSDQAFEFEVSGE